MKHYVHIYNQQNTRVIASSQPSYFHSSRIYDASLWNLIRATKRTLRIPVQCIVGIYDLHSPIYNFSCMSFTSLDIIYSLRLKNNAILA